MFPDEFAKLHHPAPATPPATTPTAVASPAAPAATPAPVAAHDGSTHRYALTINGRRIEVGVAELS